MAKRINYEQPVPLRIDSSSDTYMRIRYQHIPKSVQGENTVERNIEINPNEPGKGNVYHKLQNGETVQFTGNLITSNGSEGSSNQDCVLLFRDDEVICVPVTTSILHLSKTGN